MATNQQTPGASQDAHDRMSDTMLLQMALQELRKWNEYSPSYVSTNHAIDAIQRRLENTGSKQSTPTMALVPVRPSQGMEDVMSEEGWLWADLLAVAGAITERQYSELTTGVPDDVWTEELELIESVLKGVPSSMAQRDALRAVRRLLRAAPQRASAIWELFPAYLINHHEGETITEEGLQRALASMLQDPQYTSALERVPPGCVVVSRAVLNNLGVDNSSIDFARPSPPPNDNERKNQQ